MEVFAIRDMGNGVRCRWVHDEHHETRGSYGYDTEEETRAAEDHELAQLESGAWVALGCIVERECRYEERHEVEGTGEDMQRLAPGSPRPFLGEGTHWHETDSCWGIVIEPDHAKLDEMARWQFGLDAAA